MIAERHAHTGQGFDQLNAEGGGSFHWDAQLGCWVARTKGQQPGQKEPFARGVIRTDDLKQGDEIWVGIEYKLVGWNPTKWIDGPLRGINWRGYAGAKDNVGLSFEYGWQGASGELQLASWRSDQIGGKRVHGKAIPPTVGEWHKAEVFYRFSHHPMTTLYLEGTNVPMVISPLPNYDLSRPFILNDWQFGLVGTSGNPAPLEMHVRQAYVGPRRLFAASPAPDRAQILAQARQHMSRTTVTYSTWLKRKQAGYYKNPDLTEWAKAEKLLDQLPR